MKKWCPFAWWSCTVALKQVIKAGFASFLILRFICPSYTCSGVGMSQLLPVMEVKVGHSHITWKTNCSGNVLQGPLLTASEPPLKGRGEVVCCSSYSLGEKHYLMKLTKQWQQGAAYFLLWCVLFPPLCFHEHWSSASQWFHALTKLHISKWGERE